MVRDLPESISIRVHRGSIFKAQVSKLIPLAEIIIEIIHTAHRIECFYGSSHSLQA